MLYNTLNAMMPLRRECCVCVCVSVVCVIFGRCAVGKTTGTEMNMGAAAKRAKTF